MDASALEPEALAAISGASTAAELEDARVRYLGRKSDLSARCAAVRDRESGMTLNAVRERSRPPSRSGARRSSAPSSSARLAEERVDVTLPGDELPLGHLHPITQMRRQSRTRSSASATRSATTARSRRVEYNFDKLEFTPWHPAARRARRFFLDGERLLRTETSPSQIHALEEQRAADLHGLDRPLLPPRHDRRDALPDLPPVRGPRRRPGPDARRPEGHAPARDARALRRRSGASASARTTSRSPSRRWSRTSPAGSAAAPAAAPASTRAGSRWAAPAWSTRACSRTSASTRRSGPGFAFGCGLERVAQLRARPPGHPPALGGRPPRPEAVLMRVPLSWLRDYVARRDAARGARRAALDLGRRGRGNRAPRRRRTPTATSAASASAGSSRRASTRTPTGSSSAASTSARREPRQIVCGAWNFGAGATVAVALPGAVLPNGLELERAQAARRALGRDDPRRGRGRARHRPLAGSWCSPDGEPGTPLARRPAARRRRAARSSRPATAPDLLSVYGIAREVAALYDARARAAPRSRARRATATSRSTSTIEDFEGCPRYVGRLFRDVQIGPSPLWLKARLTAAGMRPISNVVDVTNYVMLALGNPLHAFDFDRCAGGRIVVRRARPGETLRTLDGVDRTLEPARPVIADAERAVALAGIMGGEETRDRRLDDRRAARGGELRADRDLPELRAAAAPHRGLEPLGEGRRPAPRGAGGRAGDAADRRDSPAARWVGHDDVQGDLPERPVIRLPPAARRRGHRPRRRRRRAARAPRPARLRAARRRRGGADVARARRRRARSTWSRRSPASGMDEVPFTLPARRAMFGSLTPLQRLARRVEDVLAGLGLAETYTPSLRPDDPDPDAWRLPEPISVELAVLRTRLLPSLLDAGAPQRRAGARAIGLFELAHVYLPRRGAARRAAARRRRSSRAAGAAREGVVEALYAALRVDARFERTRPTTCSIRARRPRRAPGWSASSIPRSSRACGGVRARPRRRCSRRARDPRATRT